MFSEQYSKSDFLFDTLKWNNKIDFEKRPGRERERETAAKDKFKYIKNLKNSNVRNC